MGIACYKDRPSLVVWATPQTKHVLKNDIQAHLQDTHHLVNEL